ncbi:MAG: tetratricopeptide repeat protein, partial [Bacteroidota bacterium]
MLTRLLSTCFYAFFCALTFVLIAPSAKAQKGDLQAKLEAVQQYPTRDTHRVNLILKYAYHLEWLNSTTEIDPLVPEGLEIAREIGYDIGAARILNILGSRYFHLSKVDSSLACTVRALELLKGTEYDDDIIDTYTNLAQTYMGVDSLEKALKICLEAVALMETYEPTLSHARVYFYTAKNHRILHQFKAAETYYQKAISVSKIFDYDIGIAIAESGLGAMYLEMGACEKAVPLLKRSYAFAEANNNLPNLAATSKRLGQTYLELGKYAEAIPYLEKSIELNGRTNNKFLLKQTYYYLAECYENTGQYQAAFAHFQRGTDIADSLMALERKQAVDTLLVQLNTREIAHAKALAEESEERAKIELENRTLLVLIVGLTAVVILGLLIFILQKLSVIRRQKKDLDVAYDQLEESSRLELTASRLTALKSQMNPH